MSDLNLKSFFTEVLPHLEEIEALIEEFDFDSVEDYSGEDGSAAHAEQDVLIRFLSHINDSKEIAESY